MPYDQKDLMGLDALSPTIAAYKQFVERQNNVGDPNVVQFLASRGEPQLAGLIAKKMRVENAAKAQQALAQQPQSAPPTVADQYKMAEQQQAQQAMAAQMAQMQMAQSAPGLAGMPNPAMDRASFAGGGIVAFADGGDVAHFDGRNGSTVSEIPYSESIFGRLAEWDRKKSKERAEDVRNFAGRYANELNTLAQNQNVGDANVGAYLFGGQAQPYVGINPDAQAATTSTPASTAQAAPASTTQAIPSNVPTLAELQAKYARGQAPAPSSNRTVTADSERRGSAAPAQRAPAAPAATTEDATLKNLIGAEPTLQKTKLKTEALDEEKAYIEAHKKEFGSDDGVARRAFFIQTGLDILGSGDPNVIRAIGTAAGKNYAAMQADLRALKKEKDMLDLQSIKLKQAYEQAQRTQDKEDTERYDRLHSNWMAGSLELEKMKQTARENLLNRQSAEYRTRITADAASGKTELDEKRRIYTGAISSADKVLAKYKDMPDAALTPQQKLERDAALKQRADANTALLKLGGLAPTAGTSGNIGDMSNEELMQAIAGGD